MLPECASNKPPPRLELLGKPGGELLSLEKLIALAEERLGPEVVARRGRWGVIAGLGGVWAGVGYLLLPLRPRSGGLSHLVAGTGGWLGCMVKFLKLGSWRFIFGEQVLSGPISSRDVVPPGVCRPGACPPSGFAFQKWSLLWVLVSTKKNWHTLRRQISRRKKH